MTESGALVGADDEALLEAATQARQRAYAPYSGFRVGAAVRTLAGRVYVGCNVENATNGLTLCAERVAIFAALSSDDRELAAIAIAVPTGLEARPCGICLELMHELAADARLVLCDEKGDATIASVRDLLPEPPGRST